MNKFKWLYPGIGVKRWILLIIVGFFLVSTGLAAITGIHISLFFEGFIVWLASYLTDNFSFWLKIIFGSILGLGGLAIIFISLSKIENVVSRKIVSEKELIDVLYEESRLEKGPRIVSLGGGTGLSNLLRGLKNYTSNITAVVTVADDGGSSGRLREEMGILPPGDIRNCLIALADREPLMQKLLQHRFRQEGDLTGHSFGNLFIASMTEIVDGNFEQAVKTSSKVLAIKGQVLPVTNENIRLGARYEDGSQCIGESEIPETDKNIKKVFLRPDSCKPSAAVLEAIVEAEIITLGPGSLYTSILPNLMVDGIAEAIKESAALKIYICNVMTQAGETDGFTAADHVRVLFQHTGPGIIDYVLVNSQKSPLSLRKKYREEGSYPVALEKDFFNKGNDEFPRVPKVVEAPLLSSGEYIRHDPVRTAAEIFNLYGGKENE